SVLITGGSRGLGLEMARLFAAEGASLALLGRSSTTLQTARMELEKMDAQVLAIPCDIRNSDDVHAAVKRVVEVFGTIDVLVNNAGIIQVGPFQEMNLDDYQNAMATHLWGSLYACLAVIPEMRRRGAGRIVNISSIGGKIGVPHMLPYTISK